MSGSGPSGPAEGHGPGRRDAARQGRRPGAADAPTQRDGGSDQGAAATPLGDEPLTGAGESPWVRFDRGERDDGAAPPRTGPSLPDLSALLLALESLRSAVPRELSDQLAALLRELMLTVRALIDWYLERLDGEPADPGVEDIPIE
jgi:hypothetical protein